jgi:transposase-like protein
VDYVSRKLKSIDDNLCVHKLNEKYYIKHFRVYCPECYSKNVIMYGNKSKPIIIDKEGLVDCEIKQYKCNCCNHRFSVDISSIVRPKVNISNEILEIVRKYYLYFLLVLERLKKVYVFLIM